MSNKRKTHYNYTREIKYVDLNGGLLYFRGFEASLCRNIRIVTDQQSDAARFDTFRQRLTPSSFQGDLKLSVDWKQYRLLRRGYSFGTPCLVYRGVDGRRRCCRRARRRSRRSPWPRSPAAAPSEARPTACGCAAGRPAGLRTRSACRLGMLLVVSR